MHDLLKGPKTKQNYSMKKIDYFTIAL